MTLIKKFKKIYDNQHDLALFILFFASLVLSFAHPAINYYLKFFTSYYAYGRSNGQLRLFLIFGCVVLLLRFMTKKTITLKHQHLLLFLLLGFQLLSFLVFQFLTNQPLLDTSWPTVLGYTSVNAPTHMHVLKPVMHILLSSFLSENFLSQYDTGFPFLSYMPLWWYLIGCALFLTAMISQIVALGLEKDISLLKIICGFGILKLCIDGGGYNPTGVVLIFFYLFEHGLLKNNLWKFFYSLLFIMAYFVWIFSSSYETESAQISFIFGIMLRGSILWPLMKDFFHDRMLSVVKILTIIALQALTFQANPWVSGELFPYIISQDEEIVTLILPQTPWKLGDERKFEIKDSHQVEALSEYQSKILAFDTKKDKCEERTVFFSADVLGVESAVRVNDGPLSITGEQAIGGVMRLKGRIEGCFPLTRGVQNAVLFTLVTRVSEKFIYKNERIWNHPHTRYFVE